MRRHAVIASQLLILGTLAACQRTPEAAAPVAARAAPPAHAEAAIAWRQGDVDDAFAEARESGRPVLLYWGAVWCPPCNRLKATLFKDPAFIALTRNFIPVYLDGDLPGAQAWGERFGVRGYPTLVVLGPDRQEITRLSGGNDSQALVAALKRAASRRGAVADVLQAALDKPAAVSADDWALLADYGWEVDASRLVGTQSPPVVLRRLAANAPDAPLRRHFTVLALTSDDDDAPVAPAERAALDQVLANPVEVHANQAALRYGGADLVKRAAKDPAEREQLGARLLAAVQADAGAKPDADTRLGLVLLEIGLARNAQPEGPLPQALVERAHKAVADADAQSRTAYERQGTVSTAVYVLQQVGDDAGAEQLLLAELPRSHTPYYYMPDLADLAEKRGDKAGAVQWLRKAYEGAQGPATRVQWGVLYVEGLVRLAPEDGATIEKAATQVIADLDGQPEGYHQRTRQRFEKLGNTLAEWSRTHDGAATLARLHARMQRGCAQAPGGEAACAQWLKG